MITNVYFLHFSTCGCLKKDFVIEGISGLQNSFTWGSIYLSSLQNLWMCFSIIKSISLAKSHLISGSLRINLLTPNTLRYCITLPHKWKIRSVWNHTGPIIPFAHLCGFLLWNSYTTYLFKPAVRTATQKKSHTPWNFPEQCLEPGARLLCTTLSLLICKMKPTFGWDNTARCNCS